MQSNSQPRHKFRAKPCAEDGIKFPSKLERDYYRYLRDCKDCGTIIFFLRQVPFDLPGGVKHVVDFMVFHEGGEVEFIEVKGLDLPAGKMKRKITEDIYQIKIKVVGKNGAT